MTIDQIKTLFRPIHLDESDFNDRVWMVRLSISNVQFAMVAGPCLAVLTLIFCGYTFSHFAQVVSGVMLGAGLGAAGVLEYAMRKLAWLLDYEDGFGDGPSIDEDGGCDTHEDGHSSN